MASSAVVLLIEFFPAFLLLCVVGGLVGALLAIILSYILQVIRMRRLTGLDLLRYGKAFVPAAMGSVGMLGLVLGGRRLGLTPGPIADIALCTGCCLIAYAVCTSVHLRSTKNEDTLYRAETPESAAVLCGLELCLSPVLGDRDTGHAGRPEFSFENAPSGQR